MIKIYDNLFSKIELEEIHEAFLHLREIQSPKIDFENTNKFYVKNVCGIMDLEAVNKHTHRLTEIICNDYGFNYEFNNSYIRMYFNDSYLKLHTDRKDLDITLSVNIFSNLDDDWPIHISNTLYHGVEWDRDTPTDIYEKTSKEYTTKPGQGIACYGRKHVHWRDTLVCNENQYVLQAFYHWKIKETFGKQVEITYE